jgi:RNA polymerase sigma-54 factor
MALELKQQLRQGQHLVMTPQLQQAVKMLQMNTIELRELVDQELQENPLLEYEEPAEEAEREKAEIDAEAFARYLDDGAERSMPNFNKFRDELPSYEATLTRPESLVEHLIWQLQTERFSDEENKVLSFLLGNLDDRGYLLLDDEEETARELSVPRETVAHLIEVLQSCEPRGVGARNLKECLFLQARESYGEHALPTRIVLQCLPELETKNYARIARKLDIGEEEVTEAVRKVLQLDPKPGRRFAQDEAPYITPDIYVQRVDGEYVVTLNDSGMPRLKINQIYRAVARQKGVNAETKEFIQDKLSAATGLIKSIHQRQRTIFRVTESIFKFQRDFLDKGVEHLRPLVLRDVAQDVGLHEGTVGRVTTNKYVHTPRGIFELKYFFNPGIQRDDGGADMASEAVKAEIKRLVQNEDPRSPLSDQGLVELLKQSKINIARRTVTKYRELMGILPSNKRKQLV